MAGFEDLLSLADDGRGHGSSSALLLNAPNDFLRPHFCSPISDWRSQFLGDCSRSRLDIIKLGAFHR